MVLDNVKNVPVDLVLQMGQVVLWLQTLGVITLVLFISTIISVVAIFNRRKRDEANVKRLESIEKKLDNLLSKR